MKKIVSIDDEAAVRKYIKTALRQQGYETFVTGEVDEFFRILEEQPIDLVLLDIRMPKISGFEVYRRLRKWKTMPVLFVTAYSGSFSMEQPAIMEMWHQEFADGQTDILYKPFNIETLCQKVEGLIGPPEDPAP